MIELIEETSIAVSMVGLLTALTNTQLGRRLEKQGRLHPGHDVQQKSGGDHCFAGLNFETLRPRDQVLADYRKILKSIYEPEAFAARLRRLSDLLIRPDERRHSPEGDIKRKVGSTEALHRIVNTLPEAKEIFWKTFTYCAATNPNALRFIVVLMAMYLHLGPFSRKAMASIDRQIEQLSNQRTPFPQRAHAEPGSVAHA